MSRPIKVPEDLYDELRHEADRDGVSVMDALQRRLRAGAEELARQRSARTGLERELQGVRVRLAEDTKSSLGEAARFRAEIARLRTAMGSRDERISELEETLREEMAEARDIRTAAERSVHKQREALTMAVVLLGLGACAWLGWRWWRKHRAQPEEEGQKQIAGMPQRHTVMGM